jgi:hypothetical protein
MAATMSKPEMVTMLNETQARIARLEREVKTASGATARMLRVQLRGDRQSVKLLSVGLAQ